MGALVVALIALGVVLYVQLGAGEEEQQAAQKTSPVMYRVIDTGSMNEVLASREVDGRPLNEGELFETRNKEIASQDIDFTLRDSQLSEDCSTAVWGEAVQTALAEADCTQAGRASYVSETYFGVVAVFNLADVEGSRAVAAALADPDSDTGEAEPAEATEPEKEHGFVLAPSGADPFDRLGQGYSASDAIVSGHYLVVVWVQPSGSDSVDEKVSLSSPLVALANFRDPLYRRMVQLDNGTEEATETTEQTGGADGTGGTAGTGNTGGTGSTGGTDSTGGIE